jgi:dTDP-4-dehydrorhamnose 3,5-epimerase
MNIRDTKINGFYEIEVPVFTDERGNFQQWFTQNSYLEKIGRFEPVQANTSTSKKGVIRGMHYTTSRDGQDKMVICVSGKIRDVAVDLRKDSPTFGQYDFVDLEADIGKVFIIYRSCTWI